MKKINTVQHNKYEIILESIYIQLIDWFIN